MTILLMSMAPIARYYAYPHYDERQLHVPWTFTDCWCKDLPAGYIQSLGPADSLDTAVCPKTVAKLWARVLSKNIFLVGMLYPSNAVFMVKMSSDACNHLVISISQICLVLLQEAPIYLIATRPIAHRRPSNFCTVANLTYA